MIYIGVGSNLGDRLENLRKAVSLLKARCFSSLEISIVIETKAILPEGAPTAWDTPYLNMVVCGESNDTPEVLLKKLKQIERDIGRPDSYERWSPRMIDCDILLMDNCVLQAPKLNLPHPELFKRDFLIHLFASLHPNACYQPQDGSLYVGKTFAEIACECATLPSCFVRSFVLEPHFVGIVNITPDSFSDGGSYFKPQDAIQQIMKLWHDGATVVELGGQSTRLNAKLISHEEEYARLQPVFEILNGESQRHAIKVGLDSFSAETIRKILQNYSIAWINDQKGALDDLTLSMIAESGCKFVAMHAVTIPHDKNRLLSFQEPPIIAVSRWAEQTLEKLTRFGFSEKNIVLDPGVGFGKTPYQNLSLLRDIEILKKFSCQILVGHSRKSYMTTFSPLPAAERDIETLAASAYLARMGIDYLRVHDVISHQRFFVADKIL